jgi:hypothetical protein
VVFFLAPAGAGLLAAMRLSILDFSEADIGLK